MRQEKPAASYDVQQTFAELGTRIRLARKARGWTLTELEAQCGIHRTTLGRLERGDLGVSAQVLLTVFEALQELADFSLLLSRPEVPRHRRAAAKAVLDSDF